MSKSAVNPPKWASEWIQQQRKNIEQSASSPDLGETDANRFGPFFDSLAKGFQGGAPGLLSDLRGAQWKHLGPPLGLLREHEQAWRDLGEAQAQFRHIEGELLAQLNAVQLEALALLERRVADEPVKEMRHLYDLWVECGEEVYARRVRSEAYCKTQADFANAATELRLKQQVIVERALRMFDLPTRSEINSVHRQLRELKERIHELTTVRAKSASTAAQTSGDKSPREKTSRGKTSRDERVRSGKSRVRKRAVGRTTR